MTSPVVLQPKDERGYSVVAFDWVCLYWLVGLRCNAAVRVHRPRRC